MGLTQMRVAVIGAGSFGTALAKLLTEANHEVVLWCHSPEVADAIREKRENPIYLPGLALPKGIRATTSLEEAAADREMLVAMGPSHVMRGVIEQLRPHIRGTPVVVSAAKG